LTLNGSQQLGCYTLLALLDRQLEGKGQRGVPVRIVIEATGHARWFERLIADLGFELWIGDPAARGGMRTYLILKDKAARWKVDKGFNSQASARAVLEHRFDPELDREKGLHYERLDQARWVIGLQVVAKVFVWTP